MNCIIEDFEGLGKDYNKSEIDTHYKDPQFIRLLELADVYESDFVRFYKDIDRAKKQSKICREANMDDSGNEYLEQSDIPIHLLTATRSKGHQFDAVIVLEANEGEWPSALSEDLEEERRLFYVAMTRAKRLLYFI